MAKKRECIWFFEPLDSRTNEIIAKSPGVGAEDCHLGIICADGKPHNLWEVPSGTALMLHRSRNDMKTKFRIWEKQGQGKIYDKTKWLSREKGTGKKKQKRSRTHARS